MDEAIEQLLEASAEPEALRRIELGVNHEEQHQELLLTDILHAFFTNPLRPIYLPEMRSLEDGEVRFRKEDARSRRTQMDFDALGTGSWRPRLKGGESLRFLGFEGGLREVGNAAKDSALTTRCRGTGCGWSRIRSRNRLVTCGEYAEFMADGGYRKPELWLSAGWDAVQQNGWRAPLYWSSESGDWSCLPCAANGL